MGVWMRECVGVSVLAGVRAHACASGVGTRFVVIGQSGRTALVCLMLRMQARRARATTAFVLAVGHIRPHCTLVVAIRHGPAICRRLLAVVLRPVANGPVADVRTGMRTDIHKTAWHGAS